MKSEKGRVSHTHQTEAYYRTKAKEKQDNKKCDDLGALPGQQ